MFNNEESLTVIPLWIVTHHCGSLALDPRGGLPVLDSIEFL
jgi:hypothetical protein